MSQFGGMWFDIIAVNLFQGLSNGGVESRFPGLGHLFREFFSNEGMGKLIAAPGQLLDEQCRHRLLQHLSEPVFRRVLDQWGNQARLKFPAADCRDGQDIVAFLRQAIKPSADHVSDTLGNTADPRF